MRLTADVAFGVAATDGKHEQRIFFVQPAHVQPARKDGLPPFVVGSRRQLGNIVDGRISLDATELAKVIHRMAAVASAAADTGDEQASAALPHCRKIGCKRLDRPMVDRGANAGRIREKFIRMPQIITPTIIPN